MTTWISYTVTMKNSHRNTRCERGEIGDKNAYDVGNGNDRVSGSNHGPGRTDRSRLGGEQNGL